MPSQHSISFLLRIRTQIKTVHSLLYFLSSHKNPAFCALYYSATQAIRLQQRYNAYDRCLSRQAPPTLPNHHSHQPQLQISFCPAQRFSRSIFRYKPHLAIASQDTYQHKIDRIHEEWSTQNKTEGIPMRPCGAQRTKMKHNKTKRTKAREI